METLRQTYLDPHFVPIEPSSIEESGLSPDFVADLALKTIYKRTAMGGFEMAEALKLPFLDIVDHTLELLRREHLIEVKGSRTGGMSESAYQYAITERGRTRAHEAINENGYVGPAPVPLDAYNRGVAMQALTQDGISEERIRGALRHLVLPDRLLAQIGPAVNSAKSIFLFGNTGNGKTAIAEAIGAMLPGSIYVPYAINVDNHVIKLHDDLSHRPGPEKKWTGTRAAMHHDQRWALTHRPVVTSGGELTLEALDLSFDPTNRYYEAPYQMKANGGLFLIDDFGRQQVRPRDLLNRWIMPLEKRVDYMTLATGRKLEVPFDALIILSTNLNPSDLVDEAFLRRIRYKIHVPDPNWEEFAEIFARVCRDRGIEYDERALQHLKSEYYVKANRVPRGVHPRDIVEELIDISRYRGLPARLSSGLLDEVCSTYFIDKTSEVQGNA